LERGRFRFASLSETSRSLVEPDGAAVSPGGVRGLTGGDGRAARLRFFCEAAGPFRSNTARPPPAALMVACRQLGSARAAMLRMPKGKEGAMPQPQRVAIRKRTRPFDDFFKIDELVVAHQKSDGSMSEDQRRLIFERGDSAAVLLFNSDSKCVVVVNQFKAPTLGKSTEDGWIEETVAGMIDSYETPEAAAARETLEETGYAIRNLKLIAKFFSSPGGSSERIFLYYAEVRNADKVAAGGGVPAEGEDIAVKEIPLDDLLQRIRQQRVEDPKLLIGGLWLGEELKGDARSILGYSSVRYELVAQPRRFIGYKTGPIEGVRGVDLWVNSENEDMIMDRFIGRSISANIRYLGADKDAAGNLTDDIINNDLTAEIGARSPVRIGSVFETTSGLLNETHGVDAILHVASVRGAGAGRGVKADVDDLAHCVRNVLTKADERNRRSAWLRYLPWIRRLFGLRDSVSILFPMIGAGDGGLTIEQVVPRLFGAATGYFQENPATTMQEIYFLAYTASQRTACEREIDRLCHDGIIRTA
jgi:nudix-type nucleoside diphosphatase (YffH/AdpP family)